MKIHGREIPGRFITALPEIPCQPECRGEEHAEYAYFPPQMSDETAMTLWERQKEGLVIVTNFERRKDAPMADQRFVSNDPAAIGPTPEEAGWPAYLVRFRFVDRVGNNFVVN